MLTSSGRVITTGMSIPSSYRHRELIEEYRSLDTAEDRLAWLMERPSAHTDLSAEDMTSEKRVPGCLSGLWLKGSIEGGMCSFHARSESPMVQGVVAFLCELLSGIQTCEVLALTTPISGELNLEGLLSTTRKRAVASTLAYIRHVASPALAQSPATSSPHATL